jgi:hypothetical protein
MFSLFSNYLEPFVEEGLLQDLDQSKPSNVYEMLRIAYNQGATQILNSTRLFVPYYDGQDPDDYDYDLLYYIYSNEHLQELIQWFNYKVLPEFATLSYQTLSVRLRIFTSELNTLVNKGYVDKDMAIRIHLNLTENVQNEHNLLINEELPF